MLLEHRGELFVPDGIELLALRAMLLRPKLDGCGTGLFHLGENVCQRQAAIHRGSKHVVQLPQLLGRKSGRGGCGGDGLKETTAVHARIKTPCPRLLHSAFDAPSSAIAALFRAARAHHDRPGSASHRPRCIRRSGKCSPRGRHRLCHRGGHPPCAPPCPHRRWR